MAKIPKRERENILIEGRARDKKAKGGDAKTQVGGQDKRKDLGGWPLWKAL